jgi:regulator of sigma E protease
MAISIIIGVLVLSVILLSHEIGHFVTAKMAGVRVEEFGLGYPPRLFKLFTRGDTIYSINAIPFGGFTKMTGEEDPSDPKSLAGKSRGKRLLVLSGGSIVNILLALLLFSVSYLIPRQVLVGDVLVEDVAQNSPAEDAGIQTGDIILSVNGQEVHNTSESYQIIMENLGKAVTFTIRHPDSTVSNIQVVPRRDFPEGEGAIGIEHTTINAVVVKKTYPVWQAIPLGAVELADMVVMWVDGLISVFTGEAPASFVGPVGIAQLTGEVAEVGIIPLFKVAALISMILGIMNLFPIPALDGGRITFVILEIIRRGKRIKPRTEGIIHLVGFAMLIVFMIAVTYQDIMRIISGESLI